MQHRIAAVYIIAFLLILSVLFRSSVAYDDTDLQDNRSSSLYTINATNNCSPFVGSAFGKLKWLVELSQDIMYIDNILLNSDDDVVVSYLDEIMTIGRDGTIVSLIVPPMNADGWAISPTEWLILLNDGRMICCGEDIHPSYLEEEPCRHRERFGVMYIIDQSSNYFEWLDIEQYHNAIPAVDNRGMLVCAMEGTGIKKYHVGIVNGKETFLKNDSEFKGQIAIAEDNNIYVCTNEDLMAISENGDILWESKLEVERGIEPIVDESFKRDDENWAPFPWNYPYTGELLVNGPMLGPEGNIYVGTSAHLLTAYSSDGRLLWRKEILAYNSMPAISMSGNMYVMDPMARIWRIEINGSTSLFMSFTEVRGEELLSAWLHLEMGMLLVDAGETIYAPVGRNLFAVRADGSVNWHVVLPAFIIERPLIGSNGTVYVCCNDGKLYAIGD